MRFYFDESMGVGPVEYRCGLRHWGERMMVLSLESWKMQCQPTAFRHTTSLS